MALYSDSLFTPTGGLGAGGKGNLAFVIVLGIFYIWRKNALTRQMNALAKQFTAEDKKAMLQEIVG